MEDLSYLQKSFEEFNRATSKIMEAYGKLEKEFARLNIELGEKNLELERLIGEKEDVKNYLHNILESLTTGVVVVDLEGNIQTVNRCAEMFLQESRDRLTGKNINSFFMELSSSQWDNLLESEYLASDIGKRVVLNDRVLDIFGSTIRARNGEIFGAVLVLRDITKMERLEEIAKRSEKLAAMGEMAANIAHEIRNPLGSIELFSSLLLKDLGEKKNKDRVMHIIGSVKNMNNKISNLLFFAGANPPQMEQLSLCDALREIIEFTRTIIDQAGISLEVMLDHLNPTVSGDAEMLKQVFLNIILNALQAMPSGGQLSIKSSMLERMGSKGGNGFYEVLISDTGAGIPAERLSRIFDPFFSTKEGSSGLGLAIAHNIVSLHKGEIHVKSRVNYGTTFAIALPVCSLADEAS
ncbi:MAG: ATP-binding protein [Smithellaceae bacterium]|nr:ATP-binding protein [Smithellaceae bacterium]